MVKQQKAITTLDTKLSTLSKGTDEYKQTLAQLHVAQQNFNADFGPAAKGLDSMQQAWARFKDATRDVTTGVMAKAFDLIATVLPKLVPVSNAAGQAIGGLIDDLSNWTKSAGFNDVIKWLKTSGPAAITHFGHAIGNVVDGLGGILKNFVGPGDHAAASLERLTKRFADWGHSKGVSDSVDKFLKYVSANGPKISSAMQSLADILPKLASAAGSLGSANLTAISMFLNLLASMPQGVFDVVVKGLFGIAVASKAVSLALGIQAIVEGVTVAITLLGEACLLTRIQLYALAISEAVAAAPFTAIAIGIGLLIAGLVLAYNKVGWFHKAVDVAFHGIASVALAAFNFIKSHWALLFTILTGPVGLAVVAIVKNFDKVIAAVKVVGKAAIGLWNNAFQPALQFIVKGIGVLVDIWGHMLSALGHVPGFGWAKEAGAALQSAADKAYALANNINKIPSHKTSTIVVNTIHNVVHTTGGHVPAFAKGTSSAPGGMALVGESGPELVSLPRGSRVDTASRTRSLLAGGGGGGGVTVVVNAGGLVDPQSVARLIHKELLKLKRKDLGGAALGLS
jgi:hypothetical protein